MERTALQTVDSSHSARNGSPVGNGSEPRVAKRIRNAKAPATQSRKIAILGKAPSSQSLAPYDDPTWEIWILNTIAYLKECKRWDRQFELHDLELTKAPGYGNYHSWLCSQTKPVYVREPSPDIPAHIVYPRDDVQRFFGLNLARPDGPAVKLDYFTNTVSWMMALAIYEGCSEIGLYGVDMAQHGVGGKSEYAHQRPSCELFVGYALARGIKVTIPDTSDLLKAANLYGFETHRAFPKKITQRETELKARISDAETRRANADAEAHFLTGALEDMQWFKQWIHSEDK